MINVEKVNEVYLRVYSEPGIEQELNTFFQFDVPGARFTPMFKAKMWDGKLRMYDLHRKTLYVGLLHYLNEFAKRNEYDINYVNEVNTSTEISLQDVKDYTQWLNMHSRGEPIEVRDYQHDAIHQALSRNRVMLLSPTASGKSLIIYSAIRHHVENGRKCILIVPSVSLVEQMHADFKDYSSNNGWKVEYHCQKLYSGFSKDFNSDVLLTTWQSIYKQPATWFKQFDVIFGDEAHQFKAKSLTSVMEKMTSAKYRIGTTGTLDNSKCFSGETPITTINGKKKIREIEVNDIVLTMNEVTKELEYKPVLRKLNNGKSNKMLKIITQSGEMIVTPDHEIHTTTGWKMAKDLTLEDEIICIK